MYYSRERALVMSPVSRRCRDNYTQLVAEHAVRLCDYVTRSGSNNDIENATTEWIHLLTRNERPGSEFEKQTRDLMFEFTDELVAYADGKAANIKLDKIVAFFDELSGRVRGHKKYWIEYTGAVLSMVDAYRRHGGDSETFKMAGGVCIDAGRQLGRWLDFSLTRTPWR